MTYKKLRLALSMIFCPVVYIFLKGCRHEYVQKESV